MTFLKHKFNRKLFFLIISAFKKNYKIVLLIGIVYTLIGFLYLGSLSGMLANSGFGIDLSTIFYLSVFIFLLYIRKSEFVNIKTYPSFIFGSIFLLSSLFILYISELSGILILKQLSFLSTFLGVTLLLFGKDFLKLILLPLLFLIIPLGYFDFILNTLTIYLQVITAIIAGSILNGLGMSTIISGPVMYLPHITLLVEQSCNGVNHITALIILAVILGSSKPRKIQGFLIVFSFVLGIFLNGIRVALIGIWALFFEGDLFHGPGGIFYVTFIFVTGSLFLIFIAHKFKDVQFSKKGDEYIYKLDQKKMVFASLITLTIISISTLIINFHQPVPQVLARSLDNISYQISGFDGIDSLVDNTKYSIMDADDVLNRLYKNSSGDSLFVYLAYLEKQHQDREVVNYINLDLYNKSSQVQIDVDLKLNHLKYTLNKQNGEMYFGYIIDGEIYNNPLKAKFATLWKGLLKNRTNGAFLVIFSNSKSGGKEVLSENRKEFIGNLIVETKNIF